MSGIKMSQSGLDDRIRNKGYDAVAAGADGLDIRLARHSGIDARDIMHLRSFTRDEKLLIVFRCPKRNALAFHGDLPARTWATKTKTNETGTVRGSQGVLMVSDYDMMSMWRYTGTGFQKIFVSALEHGAASGPWGPEARRIVRAMIRNPFMARTMRRASGPQGPLAAPCSRAETNIF